MKKIRIIFTGGGTGGHIYPLVAVFKEVKRIADKNNREIEARFFGASGKYQTMLEGYGMKIGKIISSKIRRYFSPLNLLEPFKFIYGIFQALIKVYFFMPDVIFSKGGPGALPVVLAGFFYRIPVIIHESDAVPGLTNRISAKFAKRIAISFKSAEVFFNGKKTALVGNPVRDDLINNRDDQIFAKRYWGFNPEKPVILVLGGSQGSEIINDVIIRNAPELLKKYQIIHQTGEDKFKEAKGELEFIGKEIGKEEAKNYQLLAYLSKDLKEAYTAADLVVGRAGAGTIFEIASFGKPAILIPLANSAGEHQRLNAYEFTETGGGKVIEEDNLLNNVLLIQIDKILSDKDNLKKMQEASLNFFIPNSAEMIGEEIFRIASF
ncbi:MAG: undecaprenyldiphospho-muramoylpentapeptide beta-N-acetylglucosaminyltransferase [Candidatus Paceibacterota bacterium]